MPDYRRMRLDPVDIKLLILYLMKQARQPLSAAEITDFVLADSLLDFFETHHYIGALLEERQIEEVADHTYQLTEAGLQAIEFFENRLPYSILEKIRDRMAAFHKQELMDQLVAADYIPINEQEYQVQLSLKESTADVPFELKFTVVGKEAAKQICHRWKENYASVYGQIINLISQM
ncbi:MAG: DUF4364 family protein [Clostridia bacterium]|nr:DUF4364 family protein [Clostridia bacterium]